MSQKLNLLVVDMETAMQDSAKHVSFYQYSWYSQQIIMEAFENYREERQIANVIKKQFDKEFSKFKLGWWNRLVESWNCVVGKNFGSHIIHQTRAYLFATFNDEISILLWKAAWVIIFRLSWFARTLYWEISAEWARKYSIPNF